MAFPRVYAKRRMQMLFRAFDVFHGFGVGIQAQSPATSITISVSCRDDSGVLDHEDYRSLRGAGAMQDSLRNDGALSRGKFHGSAFEIDQQLAFDYVEKFVIVIVLVPVIFALHYAKTNDGAIHLTERLVVPLVGARIGEGLFVNEFQRLVEDVESRLVRKIFNLAHKVPPPLDHCLLLAKRLKNQEPICRLPSDGVAWGAE